MSALSSQQIRHLHDKAQSNLDIKLKKVPCRVFLTPGIVGIYDANEDTVVEKVPGDLQLPFFFSRYNDIARTGFVARVDTPDFDICRAIWYYQMDRKHTFDIYYSQARINLLVAVLVKAMSDKSISICAPEALRFAEAYIDAWCWHTINPDIDIFTPQEIFLKIWREAHYDLITFSSSQLNLANKAYGKLRAQLEREGLKLALQWILYFADLGEATEDELEEPDIRTDVEFDLAAVNWNAPIVNGVLQEVDEHIIVPPLASTSQPWIPTTKAIDLLRAPEDAMTQILDSVASGG